MGCDLVLVDCPAGQFAVNGVCQSCPAGKFFAGTAAGCEDCPAGTYHAQDDATIVTCQPCDFGSYSGVGAAACTPCDQARHFTTLQAGVSDPAQCTCPMARFWNREADSCDACPPNSYCAGGTTLPLVYEEYYGVYVGDVSAATLAAQ